MGDRVTVDDTEQLTSRRCARVQRFSLHADVPARKGRSPCATAPSEKDLDLPLDCAVGKHTTIGVRKRSDVQGHLIALRREQGLEIKREALALAHHYAAPLGLGGDEHGGA